LAYNNAARAFMDQNRFADAARLLDQALERRRNSADVQNNVAVVLRRLGRPEEALEHYRTAERLNPRSAEIQHNIGLLLAEEELRHQSGFSSRDEQYQVALDHYRRALVLKSDEVKTLNDLGILYKKLGKIEDAIASYEQAIAIDPDHVNARYNLAIALTE